MSLRIFVMMAAHKGTGRRAAGRFGSREALTRHVWAMRRQQVFPQFKAIAAACGVTAEVVKAILETEEGLQDYLQKGCLIGDGRDG
jgi:hypothetical protein